MIDGQDGVDASYSMAGLIGIRPHGMTLRRLWKMACGVRRQRRNDLADLATLVWSIGEIDVEAYLAYGTMESTGAGGPVQLDPEMQARVDAEAEKIRRENPELPQVRGIG